MKLSEAILLGSIGTEQANGAYRDENGRTCALGAALMAIGKLTDDENRNTDACTEAWMWPMYTRKTCPECHRDKKVSTLIPHLNDFHKWTRPQIAAWVATIEPHIDERKCETNEVSAQDEAVTETVQDAESQTVR